ncbi:60S ribosomal protein L6A [Asimina triloba]
MYHKRGLWAVKAKNGGSFPHHDPKPKPDAPVEKPPKFYPADDVKKPIANHRKPKPTKLRPSITPGTVLILLAGRFMGKRVVFLKQLASGLLLVTEISPGYISGREMLCIGGQFWIEQKVLDEKCSNWVFKSEAWMNIAINLSVLLIPFHLHAVGPFKVNGVPLRRVNQSYVIATSTKVDISGVNADKFDDKYFTKEARKKKKKTEGEFFEADKEEKKTLPQDKKDDQKAVDAQLIKSIEAVPDLKAYLAARFSLRSGMKPHELLSVLDTVQAVMGFGVLALIHQRKVVGAHIAGGKGVMRSDYRHLAKEVVDGCHSPAKTGSVGRSAYGSAILV